MKSFKPFDKVLVRAGKGQIWNPAFYSNRVLLQHHVIACSDLFKEEDILPYEGNEYLVGKKEEPQRKWILRIYRGTDAKNQAETVEVTNVAEAMRDLLKSDETIHHIAIFDKEMYQE